MPVDTDFLRDANDMSHTGQKIPLIQYAIKPLPKNADSSSWLEAFENFESVFPPFSPNFSNL
jgi:hypothetical protein